MTDIMDKLNDFIEGLTSGLSLVLKIAIVLVFIASIRGCLCLGI